MKVLTKCLVEANADQADIARPYQNFSTVKLPQLATNKSILKINTVLLAIHLMTNISYFTEDQTGLVVKGLSTVPPMRSTQFFAEQDSLNMILQLLLYKDKQVAKATLQFIAVNFRQESLLAKSAEYNTFWERILYSGLRKGLALPAIETVSTILKDLIREPVKYDSQLKALDRLFPKFILRWIINHKPEESTFLLDFAERIDAEVYWTEPMFDKLKNTIGQIFPLDLQNIEEFTSGRKKVMPKARNPPVTIQIYYDLPKELLSVEGLFLNSLIDERNAYDFSDKKLVPDTLLQSSLHLLEEKIASKEFATYENISCSHARILARTILKFVRANKVSAVGNFEGVLSLLDKVSEHWVKHSTRIAVRGPQINFYFTQTLIDLVKTTSTLFALQKGSADQEMALMSVSQRVSQKLLKKLSIDKNKITYLEFKLFKAILKLDSLIISTKKENVLSAYASIVNDINSDQDFSLVHGLRFIAENLALISAAVPKAAAKDELQAEEAEAQQKDSEEKAGPGEIAEGIVAVAVAGAQVAIQAETHAGEPRPKQDPTSAGIVKTVHDLKEHKKVVQHQKANPHSVPVVLSKQKIHHQATGQHASVERDSKASRPAELVEAIAEFLDVRDTTNLNDLGLPIVKSFESEEIRDELKKKLIIFNYYLTDILTHLVEVDLVLPGLVRNGIAYTILDIILRICSNFDIDEDERLKKIANNYTLIFRKVLAASTEATIHHFGEENCPNELTVRGTGSEDFAQMLEKYDQTALLPLVEFFRVIRKNCHMEFVIEAIKGYRSFSDTTYQDFANDEFTQWLSKQKNIAKPEFVWSTEYSAELSAVLVKQVTSILHSRKANFSYYLDDFKSTFLSHFTRVGDIFLEPLVLTQDYKIEDPIMLLKKVKHH